MALPNTKIILIEGPFGPAKSALARELAENLEGNWTVLTEWEGDHPLHLEPSQILGQVRSPNLELTILSQWELFVQQALQTSEGIILESQAWQHAALFQLAADKSEKAIFNLNHLLNGLMTPLNPVLIMLAPELPKNSGEFTIEPGWKDWVPSMCEELPWTCNRGLTGEESFNHFSKAWKELSGELFSASPFPKILLDDYRSTNTPLHRQVAEWLSL